MALCGHCGAQNAVDASACSACAASLAAPPDAAAPQPAPPTASLPPYRIAHLGNRLAATILDGTFLIAIFVLTGMAALVKMGGIAENGFSFTSPPVLHSIGVTLLAGAAYFWLCEGLFGATMGKALAGIQVRAKSGARCGLGASLVRNLLRVVDGLGAYLFGFIVAMSSNLRQRLGDYAAGTVVVEHKLSRVARSGLIMLWFELLAAGLAGAFLLNRTAAVPESSTILVQTPAPAAGREAISIELLENNGGPARPLLPYRPGDTVFLKFDITGCAKDSDSRPNVLVNILTSDPSGLPLHRPWADSFQARQDSGSPVYGAFHFTLPAFVPAGAYKITIQAHDQLSNRDFQTSSTFEVENPQVVPPQGLEVRDLSLSLLQDGPPAKLPVVHGGGVVYMRCNLFGMEFRGDQVNGRIALRVISPSGRVVLNDPKYVDINTAVLYHPASFYFPVHGDLNLPAALERGTYTERFTVFDNFGNRAVGREARFEVQ